MEYMNREMRFAYLVIASAIVLTGVFHALVYEYPFGWPFALFITLITLLLIIVRQVHAEPQNLWAYAFLGPLVLGLISDLLYSNDVVQSLGQLLTVVSLALFSYWLFAPKTSLKTLPSFWPSRLFMETLVPIEGAGPASKLSFSTQGRQVLIGAAIAVPFLLIFLALFISADALLGKVLREIIDIQNPAKLYVQVMADIIIGYYLLRFLWSNITRIEHKREPRWLEQKPEGYSIASTSFLSALNLLFLGFIAFQFVYFFGGKEIIESYGITYASYAREGFFQLFTVSVFVFAIICGIGHLTRFKSLAVRLLSLGLILQSLIVIASAMKRFTLYIDAYGMSVLRFWAFTGLIFAAVGLLVLGAWIAAKASFESVLKVLALGCLYAFSAMLLLNYESVVVNWNANRSATELVQADYFYPATLSSDAMPAYLAWLKSQSADEKIDCGRMNTQLILFLRASAKKYEQAKTQLDAFNEATRNRYKLSVSPAQYDEYNNETAEYMTDWFGPAPTECYLTDLNSGIRVFYQAGLKSALSDARQWTMSNARALEALSQF